jgi:galactoside O-acetyltransferase
MTSKNKNDTTPIQPRDTLKLLELGLTSNFWNYIERVTGQKSLRKFLSQGLVMTLLSDFPSILGVILRGQAYRKFFGSMGKNCFIEKNVRFRVPSKIFLGHRVFIDENVCIDATYPTSEIRMNNDVAIGRNSIIKAGIGKIIIHDGVGISKFVHLGGGGGIEIGENSMLGDKVEIISAQHVFDDPSIPIKLQGSRYARIEIGSDVWLGAMVIVLPGVKIGDGSVVGAGAVVTKDIPSYSVAAGVPAKVIKKRELNEGN